MTDLVQWLATLPGIAAAIIVAGKFSGQMTGWGFLVFAFSSIEWIVFGAMERELPLTLQNAVLFVVNLVGVWLDLIVREKA